MACVEKLPHSCGTKDALQVFKEGDKYTGFCFRCRTYIPDPYHDKEPGYTPVAIVKSPQEIEEELKEIDGYPSFDIEARKLHKETLDYFKVKVAVSEEDGTTPVALYYPYTKNHKRSAYKVRILMHKYFYCIGEMKGVDLFGWEQAIASGGSKLIITEGQDDAMALFQAMKQRARGGPYENNNPAVVSLVNGSSSAKRALTDKLNEIRQHFKEVILAFDQDDAGNSAVQDVMKIIPTAKVASYPGKDPNDAVMAGKGLALANAVLFKAETPKNTRLVLGQSLFAQAKKPAERGIPWPWRGMDDLTKGIRWGEVIYIGAGQKQGKSEVVDTLIAHFIKMDYKVLACKLEQSNIKTVKQVLGKMSGRIFHDPDIPFDEAAYEEAEEAVADRLILLDLYQHAGWETLKQDIIAAAQKGCKFVFIDPITNLTGGISSGEANTMLREIAQDLAAIARDNDLIIFVMCHLRNPDTGEPHERGGRVQSHQFAGSRAMAQVCHMMIGLEGNRDPALPDDQRNIRKLVLLEEREFGRAGEIVLFWNRENGLFTEIQQE